MLRAESMPTRALADRSEYGLLFTGPSAAMRRVALPRPEPAAGELAVRVRLCALCGSDLHSLLGRREVPLPTILGHEVCGTVLAIGEGSVVTVDGRQLNVGDRIVFAPCASCGDCARCRRGIPQKCDRLIKFGDRRQSLDAPATGGFASAVLVPRGTPIVRVPDSLSDTAAAVCACAVATVATAAAALARVQGAREVIVVDPDERRRERILAIGARPIIGDAAMDDLHHLAADPDDEIEIAIECSGSPAAMASQHRALGIGGIQVLVGAVLPTPPFVTGPEHIVRRMLQLRGLHNYTGIDLLPSVQAMSRPGFPLANKLGPTLPLSAFDDAIDLARSGEHLRVFLAPSP
jgi:threonine dehydrogenase-like Zn-dependent dehydrogenase